MSLSLVTSGSGAPQWNPPAAKVTVERSVEVKVPEATVIEQQADLQELLRSWTVPLQHVQDLLMNPSCVFNIREDLSLAVRLNWKNQIEALKKLLPTFDGYPFNIATLRIDALLTLYAAGSDKVEMVRAEIRKRMEQEPYVTYYKTIKTYHFYLLEEENYKLCFEAIDFKNLRLEEKQKILNLCKITLLLNPQFKGFLETLGEPELAIYLRKSLKKVLILSDDACIWTQEKPRVIASLAAFVADAPDLAEVATKALKGRGWVTTHFEQRLKIYKFGCELATYVRKKSSEQDVEGLRDLCSYLEGYPHSSFYIQNDPELAAYCWGDAALDCLSAILKETEFRFVKGIHWAGLLKIWTKIQSPAVLTEILAQLEEKRKRHPYDELGNSSLNLNDYEILDKILPQDHPGRWRLSGNIKRCQREAIARENLRASLRT